MDWEWIQPLLSDTTWIGLAFFLGLGAKLLGLPPLVGFLVTGFALNALGSTTASLDNTSEACASNGVFTTNPRSQRSAVFTPATIAARNLSVLGDGECATTP